MPDLNEILESVMRRNCAKSLDLMVAKGMRSKYPQEQELAKQIMVWRSMEGDEATLELVITHDRIARAGILRFI